MRRANHLARSRAVGAALYALFVLALGHAFAGCAPTLSSVREYTPLAAKLVRDECAAIRAHVLDDYAKGYTASALDAKARLDKVNHVCDATAAALVSVDDFAAFAEEARSWE